MNRHDDLARLALDANVGDRGMSETRLQILAKELVLTQKCGEVAVRVPLRSPGLGDAEAEADWMCFLTHYALLPFELAAFDVEEPSDPLAARTFPVERSGLRAA